MSTTQERRKGLISQTAKVSLLVTIDEKIEGMEIAWCLYTFKTKNSAHHVCTTYCALTHDDSISHALNKSEYKGSPDKISLVDVVRKKNVGYAIPRESDPIEIWKTKE